MASDIFGAVQSSTTDFLTEKKAALVKYLLVNVSDPYDVYKQSDVQWAEPEIDDTADWLKRLAGDEALRPWLSGQARLDAERLSSVAALARILGLKH